MGTHGMSTRADVFSTNGKNGRGDEHATNNTHEFADHGILNLCPINCLLVFCGTIALLLCRHSGHVPWSYRRLISEIATDIEPQSHD